MAVGGILNTNCTFDDNQGAINCLCVIMVLRQWFLFLLLTVLGIEPTASSILQNQATQEAEAEGS